MCDDLETTHSVYEDEDEMDSLIGDDDGLDPVPGEEVDEVDVDDTLFYSKGAMKENDFTSVLARSVHNEINHRSSNRMTKYEYTKIRGLRMQQLASGCPPFTTIPEEVQDIGEIFQIELASNRLPFIIRRQVSLNEFEYWKVRDLTFCFHHPDQNLS